MVAQILQVFTLGQNIQKHLLCKTAITSADMDANLINFAASGVKSGKFTANGMKRTAASDNAVATLVTNGWTVSGLTKVG